MTQKKVRNRANPQEHMPDAEHVVERELFGIFEEGVVFRADLAAVEAVFDGVAVVGRGSMGDGEGAAAVGAPTMGVAQLGVFDGVVFAGVAGGRVGSTGCHNAGLYTADGGEKSSS